MKIKNLVAISLITGLSSLNVSAESDPNPFANCGIGAALFKNDTGAVISNVIWDLGSTALTSGVSSPDTCEGKEAKTAEFIYESFNQIAEETAKGEGEHLTAMLNLAGCASSEHAAVIKSVRGNFANSVKDSVYSNKTTLQKTEAYYQNLRASSQGSCSLS